MSAQLAEDEDVLLDPERLAEILALDLLSGERDEALDRCVQDAAEATGMPIGLISVILDETQYFAANYGLSGWLLDAVGSPVSWSFCQHPVRSQEIFVVSDAEHDVRVMSSPLVTNGDLNCYAGVPLVTSRGYAVGTLCVLGGTSHRFSAATIATLRVIGQRALALIEERRRT